MYRYEGRENYRQYSPFFDQEPPEIEVIGIIDSYDDSEPYELSAEAVFAAIDGKFLFVRVSGCSCWPDRGSTTQQICHTLSELDVALRGYPGFADSVNAYLNKRRTDAMSGKIKSLFTTTDNRTFNTLFDAELHQLMLDIAELCELLPLSDSNNSFVLNNILVNREQLLKLLGEYNSMIAHSEVT